MPNPETVNRQKRTSSNEVELQTRTAETEQLIHDVIGRNEAFFAEPENRLNFIASQSGEDMLRIATYVNAKLRGETPHQLRQDPNEIGASLPLLHTPSTQDKPAAFVNGYTAIQEYIQTSDDSIETKIEGVAMATEALIIWVHPFNDANGRTSRFFAKLIEDGASDIDQLVGETTDGRRRNRYYREMGVTRESMLKSADNTELMFDDDQREAMRVKAETLPSDIEMMKARVQSLLENDHIREDTVKFARIKAKLAAEATLIRS